jgi:hypothetical protein
VDLMVGYDVSHSVENKRESTNERDKIRSSGGWKGLKDKRKTRKSIERLFIIWMSGSAKTW